MAATKDNSPKSPKTFDVAQPGKTPATPTSRPIVVGHGSMISHDPMVMSQQPVADQDPASKVDIKAESSRNKVITPASDSPAVKSKAETASKATPKPEPVSENSSDAAIVDAVVDQAADKKKAKEGDEAEVSKEEVARQEHINSLIADKTYFLPIGKATRQKHTRHNLVAGLVVLVLLGSGAYALYATGLVKHFGK